MNKKIVAIVISLVVLIGGGASAYYLIQNNNSSNNQSQTTQKTTEEKATWIDNVLTYKGKEGVTALALLEQNATIEKSGEGEMAFITSINGLAANPSNQYWSFNINGESATVGAGSYTTKDSDTITWKISTF